MIKKARNRQHQSGNIFALVFGAIALVGALATVTTQMVTGPIKTANQVTQKNIIESNLLINSKLLVLHAAQEHEEGDIDDDNVTEPPEYIPNGSGGCTISLTGGGCLPGTVGASKTDPYGNVYGYCVWDHGAEDNGHADGAPASPYRLNGNTDIASTVMAVISAGPDGTFQTSCTAYDGAGSDGVVESAGSDDVILKYSYAEASEVSAGLWSIKETDDTVAEIDKNLEVRQATGLGLTTASVDSATGLGTFEQVQTNVATPKTDANNQIDIHGFLTFEDFVVNGKGYINIEQIGNHGNEIGILMRLDGDGDGTATGVFDGAVGSDAAIWVDTSEDGTEGNASTKFISWTSGKLYSTGPVGINTHTPQGELHVHGNGGTGIALTSSSPNDSRILLMTQYQDIGEEFGIGNPSGNNRGWRISAFATALHFDYWDGSAFVEAFRLHRNGMNTVSAADPIESLDIDGDLVIDNGTPYQYLYFRHDGATDANNDYMFYNDLNDVPYSDSNGIFTLFADSARGNTDWTAANASISAFDAYIARGLAIGTTTPTAMVDVNGNVVATDLALTSDARFKEAIRPLESGKEGIEAVQQLHPVRYEWKDKAQHGDKGQIGFLAQDIEALYPNLVKGSAESKAVDYIQLMPLLITALQDQQKALEDNASDINALKKQLAELPQGTDQ